MGLKQLKNFYKNKRIFITGHTGFKGMWLFLILRFFGAKVKGYSLSLSKNDNFIFFRIFKKKFLKETFFNDIVDYKILSKKINFLNHILFFI